MTSQNFPDYPSYFHPRIDIGNGTVTQAIPFTSVELTANPYKKSPSICSTPDCSTPIPANNFFKSNFYVYGAILTGDPSLQYDNSTTKPTTYPQSCDDGNHSTTPRPHDPYIDWTCNATPYRGVAPDVCFPNIPNDKELTFVAQGRTPTYLIEPENNCMNCSGGQTGSSGLINCGTNIPEPVIAKNGIICGTASSLPGTGAFCATNKTLSYPDASNKTTMQPQAGNSQPTDSLWEVSNAECIQSAFHSCTGSTNCQIKWNPEYYIKCGELATQSSPNYTGDKKFTSSCTLGSSGVGKCYQPQTNSPNGPDYSVDTCLLQPQKSNSPQNWSPKYVDDTTPTPKPIPYPFSSNEGAIQCAYGAPVGMFQLRTGTSTPLNHDLWMRNFNWASTTLNNPGQVASFIKDIVKGGKS